MKTLITLIILNFGIYACFLGVTLEARNISKNIYAIQFAYAQKTYEQFEQCKKDQWIFFVDHGNTEGKDWYSIGCSDPENTVGFRAFDITR